MHESQIANVVELKIGVAKADAYKMEKLVNELNEHEVIENAIRARYEAEFQEKQLTILANH